jgi:hypothetical protein
MPTERDIERFVSAFADHWAESDGGLERLMHRGATLQVAGARDPYSFEEAEEFVAGVKRGVPDIALRVLDWAARESSVFTEWQMSGTLGGRLVSWQGINRNTLDGSKSVAAISCWDRWSLLERVEPDRAPLDLASELMRIQAGG